MPTAREQLEEIQKTSTALRSVNARGVAGGFILSGNTRWADTEMGDIRAEQNAEMIVETAKEAGECTAAYLDTGKFD